MEECFGHGAVGGLRYKALDYFEGEALLRLDSRVIVFPSAVDAFDDGAFVTIFIFGRVSVALGNKGRLHVLHGGIASSGNEKLVSASPSCCVLKFSD